MVEKPRISQEKINEALFFINARGRELGPTRTLKEVQTRWGSVWATKEGKSQIGAAIRPLFTSEEWKPKEPVAAKKEEEKKKEEKKPSVFSSLTKKQAEVTGFRATNIGRILSGIVYSIILWLILSNFVLNYILEKLGVNQLIEKNIMAALQPYAPGIANIIPYITPLFLLLIVLFLGFFVLPKMSFTGGIVTLVIVGIGVWSAPMLMGAIANLPTSIGGTMGEGLAGLLCTITSPQAIEDCMAEKGFNPQTQVEKVGGYDAVIVKFGTEANGYTLASAHGDKTGGIYPYFFAVTVENPDKEKIVEEMSLVASIFNDTNDAIVVGSSTRIQPDLCNETSSCILFPGEKMTVSFDADNNNPLGYLINDKESKELKVRLNLSYKYSGEGKNSYMIYQHPGVEKSLTSPISMTGPLDIAVYFVPEVYIVDRYQATRTYVDVYVTLSKGSSAYESARDWVRIQRIFITRLEGITSTTESILTPNPGLTNCNGPFYGSNYTLCSLTTVPKCNLDNIQTDEIVYDQQTKLGDKDKAPLTMDRTYKCRYEIHTDKIGSANYKTVPFSVVANYTNEKFIEEYAHIFRV